MGQFGSARERENWGRLRGQGQGQWLGPPRWAAVEAGKWGRASRCRSCPDLRLTRYFRTTAVVTVLAGSSSQTHCRSRVTVRWN
jgi:hypothetical protein